MSKMLQEQGSQLHSLWEWVGGLKRILQRRGHLNWKTEEMSFWGEGLVYVKGWMSERDVGGIVKNLVCIDYREGLVRVRLDDGRMMPDCKVSQRPCQGVGFYPVCKREHIRHLLGMITLVALCTDYLEEWIKVVIQDGGRGTLFKNHFNWVNLGD